MGMCERVWVSGLHFTTERPEQEDAPGLIPTASNHQHSHSSRFPTDHRPPLSFTHTHTLLLFILVSRGVTNERHTPQDQEGAGPVVGASLSEGRGVRGVRARHRACSRPGLMRTRARKQGGGQSGVWKGWVAKGRPQKISCGNLPLDLLPAPHDPLPPPQDLSQQGLARTRGSTQGVHTTGYGRWA